MNKHAHGAEKGAVATMWQKGEQMVYGHRKIGNDSRARRRREVGFFRVADGRQSVPGYLLVGE